MRLLLEPTSPQIVFVETAQVTDLVLQGLPNLCR
jgi:hypothetical protein